MHFIRKRQLFPYLYGMFWEILLDALRNAILISGLVGIMMMLIESLNIGSAGRFFAGLRRSRAGQVAVSALLGAIPGCMGGFAAVSLYTHGILSFGALVAMMIASSGDEAFVMLAMMPRQAAWIFLVLLVIAIAAGLLVDLLWKPRRPEAPCEDGYALHEEEHGERHFGWKRVALFAGIVLFLAALLSGLLEEEEADAPQGFTLLSEEWMYWLFGALSLIVLAVLVRAKDHFIEEHLWHHIVCQHLPTVFAWSFGVLLLLGFGLSQVSIADWISANPALMVLLATLVGIIPESGPHLVFVTLYASGIVPFPVLLASCISQDGHASLPLLAESKRAFLRAKLVNCIIALAAGLFVLFFTAV